MGWWETRDDWSGGRVSLGNPKTRDQARYAVVEDGVFEAPDDPRLERRLEDAGHSRLDAPPESAATDASTTMDGEGVEATSSPDTDDGAWPDDRSDVWSYINDVADPDEIGISWVNPSHTRDEMVQLATEAGVDPPEEGGE